MTTQEIQYRAAYRRARVHRDLHGFEGYGPGFVAAALRGDWSRKGYIDGWCSQDRDNADVSWVLACAANSDE